MVTQPRSHRFNRILLEMQELSNGVNSDPDARIRELARKRDEIDEEIRKIQETGEAPIFGEDIIRDQVYDLSDLVEHFSQTFVRLRNFLKIMPGTYPIFMLRAKRPRRHC